MKQVLILLLSFLLMAKGQAQILKKIGSRIKDDAAWRVSNKVDNEIRKGIDSVFEMPKKTKGKNNAKASTEALVGPTTQRLLTQLGRVGWFWGCVARAPVDRGVRLLHLGSQRSPRGHCGAFLSASMVASRNSPSTDAFSRWFEGT